MELSSSCSYQLSHLPSLFSINLLEAELKSQNFSSLIYCMGCLCVYLFVLKGMVETVSWSPMLALGWLRMTLNSWSLYPPSKGCNDGHVPSWQALISFKYSSVVKQCFIFKWLHSLKVRADDNIVGCMLWFLTSSELEWELPDPLSD